MAAYNDELKHLEHKLANDGELSPVFAYFLDHFGNNSEFIRRCKPAKNKDLAAIIQKLCEGILERDVSISGMRLFQLPKTRFYHGVCQAGSKMPCFFYFEHIEMGLLAINVGPAFGQMSYARFSATFAPANRAANVVAPSRRLIH